jgi:hypothetical protein
MCKEVFFSLSVRKLSSCWTYYMNREELSATVVVDKRESYPKCNQQFWRGLIGWNEADAVSTSF